MRIFSLQIMGQVPYTYMHFIIIVNNNLFWVRINYILFFFIKAFARDYWDELYLESQTYRYRRQVHFKINFTSISTYVYKIKKITVLYLSIMGEYNNNLRT